MPSKVWEPVPEPGYFQEPDPSRNTSSSTRLNSAITSKFTFEVLQLQTCVQQNPGDQQHKRLSNDSLPAEALIAACAKQMKVRFCQERHLWQYSIHQTSVPNHESHEEQNICKICCSLGWQLPPHVKHMLVTMQAMSACTLDGLVPTHCQDPHTVRHCSPDAVVPKHSRSSH